MAKVELNNVAIRGIACAVPDNKIENKEYYETFGQEAVDKFADSVGIKERFISKNGEITASDLCFAAAEKLLNELEIPRETIDALIFVTQHPDYTNCPATACVLQYRLHLSQDCLSYDINQGCSGYVYGLYVAASHLQNGSLKRVLLLAGDAGSNISPLDKSVAMLFGDAGSATLLEYDETSGNIPFELKTIGEGFRNIICPAGGARHKTGNHERTERAEGIVRSDYDTLMDGTEVFNFTIKEVPRLMKGFVSDNKISTDEIDLFVFHQANKFMLDYIARKSKLPKEKIPLSLARYGNTSSASIPMTLCDYMGDRDEDKMKEIIACGFGVGLTLGIAKIRVNSKNCFPIIRTLESFDDGLI